MNRWRMLGIHSDVAELEDEGVTGISWSGKRTLIVDYDGTKCKDSADNTAFVSQQRRWLDVQIIYREVHP